MGMLYILNLSKSNDKVLKNIVLLALGGRYKQTAICWLTPGMMIFIAIDSKVFSIKILSLSTLPW